MLLLRGGGVPSLFRRPPSLSWVSTSSHEQQQHQKKPSWFLLGGHLANTLTVSRMVATPVLGLLIWKGSFVWASAGFVAAGLSDWVSFW